MERVSPVTDYSIKKERAMVDTKLQAILNDQASNKDELAYYDPDIRVPMNG